MPTCGLLSAQRAKYRETTGTKDGIELARGQIALHISGDECDIATGARVQSRTGCRNLRGLAIQSYDLAAWADVSGDQRRDLAVAAAQLQDASARANSGS